MGMQSTGLGIDELPAPDTALLRKAMGRFATGVTIVTARGACGKLEGLTVNSFSTVSLEPPLVLWNLARRAGSFATFVDATYFAVNVLSRDQLHLCRHFATRRADKLAGIAHRPGIGGCPLLDDTIAQFECRRETFFDGGDHVIFVGRVLRASHGEGDPLIFSGGGYHGTAALPGSGGQRLL